MDKLLHLTLFIRINNKQDKLCSSACHTGAVIALLNEDRYVQIATHRVALSYRLPCPADAGPQAGAESPPGVLVVGQVAEPQSLDPQVATAANDSRILVNIYDGLVRNAPGSLTIEPALASRWDISPDGRRYTFHLREGVTFQDGTPFNAGAVKFTFERMLNKQHPYYHTGPFPLSFFFSSIDTITTPDAQTVVFTLKQPFAPLLSNLATPAGLIVSPAAVKKYDKDVGRHPVGTGAFRFDEWQANQRVVLTANKDYWDGAPKLEAVVFRPITDGNTRTAEMLSGGLMPWSRCHRIR